ncbi:hydrogenase formation protein HypD [Gordonia sp. PP30]|uniref:hydrogenase formation protein HypD n=1 Tax=Gordonia sp. PP30 TaxID=2935861 RepID=UPI002000216D|nr:hydrogenase formation protein HypD [Gordonia sp. PP30]UQE76479.1 hydrogenase formation protein HypD [Gordonia sp. PP30]
MRFVDEFRDPQAARSLLSAIEKLTEADDRVHHFMEVCGGHTHTIYRHGLEHLLPESVQFIHGPGCPVCVIPMGRIDDAVELAKQPGVIFLTFGDMMRVPGTEGSLLQAQANGADVRFVYSPLDALKVALDNPDKQVVFFAVGFETTAPSTAVTIARAQALGVENFSVFCNHVLIEPPLRTLLGAGEMTIDGLIGPGHVATVTGSGQFDFIPREFGRPVVVAGFEPLDILQSVEMLLRQSAEGRTEVENQYSRVVRPEGNPAALGLLAEVFAVRPSFEWRGLGWIEHSAYGLAPAYAAFDAELRFAMPGKRVADPPACECGSVLTGQIKPWECKVLGTACTPETPIGTCMVSPEGACAAYYSFGRLRRETVEVMAGGVR